VDHQTKGRLCAAALLPFRDRQPDWEGFAARIRWMQEAADHYGAELVTVLNADIPPPRTLREGAKGVQLAELGLESWEQRKWLPVEDLARA